MLPSLLAQPALLILIWLPLGWKNGKSLGFEIKVETQGAMGIENKLTENDISQAQIAIFAVDIAVEERERFNGVKVIQVPLQEALKDPHSIFAKIQR